MAGSLKHKGNIEDGEIGERNVGWRSISIEQEGTMSL